MKRKALFVAALVGLGSIANAQTTQVTNENGFVITPEAGDWAIGFDANPFLNYAGNMFNNTVNNTINAGYVSGIGTQAIYGKMFKDENTAYRAQLRIMYGSGKVNTLQDTSSTPTPGYVTNTTKQSGAGIVIGAGIEKRRGHGRLQGYYGGEVLITFGGTVPKTSTTYELAMDSANVDNFYVTSGRTIESKTGATFKFGVRGFIGAEYFFAPKLSIAAEYGWGLAISTTGQGETTKEYYDSNNNGVSIAREVYTVTTQTGKSSSFGIDTDNMGGNIKIMFHF